MTDDDVRAAFAGAVPTPPAAPDRAAGARAHARRRRARRTGGAMVAAAVAVVAVAVVPSTIRGDVTPAPVSPTTPPAVSEPVEIACPAFTEGVAATGPSTVGGDVVGARLCQGSGSPYDAPDVVIGAGDAQAIAESVDRAPVVPEPDGCDLDAGPGFLIVFAHADGSTQVVRGELYGCRLLTVGGVRREGAVAVEETARLTALGAAARAADAGCPTEPAEQSSGPDRVSAGAVAVRLCHGPGLAVQEPVDALRTGIDTLTAAVNDTSPIAGSGCRLDLGQGYSLLFIHADGTTETVVAQLRGCRSIYVGDDATRRAGPQEVLDTFVELLRAQREPQDVVGHDKPPTCPAGDPSVVGTASEIRQGLVCFQLGSDRPSPDRAEALTPDELRVLVADLDDPGSREMPMGGCGLVPQVTLVGTTLWGDTVVQPSYCGGTWIVGDRYVPWSEATYEIVERLQERAGGDPPPTVTADTSPEALVPAYVDLHNLGRVDQARALWVDPDDAAIAADGDRVDFKLADRKPVDVDGWAEAWEVYGVEGNRGVIYVVVRQSPDENLRILSRR